MGCCGGACGGDCACATRAPGAARQFGPSAEDSDILIAVRDLQLEDSGGVAVVLTRDEWDALKAGAEE